MNAEPLLSVIIPNWNGKKFLAESIDSLKGQTFHDFETILVDNGSTDGSADFAEERYGKFIRILRNKENLGFAGGNNIGIQAARGEYIVLLNNDTWADPHWLEELVKATQSDPVIGMWASKVCSYYQRDRIEAAGELIYWDGLCRARGQYERDHGQYNAMEEILFPPGCGAMYRKSLFDGIGLFDEDFFAYADDSEIGIRARLAGWKCLFVPPAIVYHKNSGTAGQYSPLKAFYVERNRLWITFELIRKNRLREEYAILWLFTGIVVLVFSLWPEFLLSQFFAKITGMFYLSAVVVIAFLFLLLIVLHFSVVISKLTGQNKELAQRHALLELEFNEFKKRYLPSEIRSS